MQLHMLVFFSEWNILIYLFIIIIIIDLSTV